MFKGKKFILDFFNRAAQFIKNYFNFNINEWIDCRRLLKLLPLMGILVAEVSNWWLDNKGKVSQY